MDEDELVYVCASCGHEAHPDRFGKYCPSCGTDLDELEAEATPETEPHCTGHQHFDIDCIDCSDALERQRKA